MNEMKKPGILSELGNKDLDRRALVKGAAWSAPVLAAAVAAPLAAATTVTPPDCPNCMKPNFGLLELAGLAASSRATLVMAAPLTINAAPCGFLTNIFRPAFTFIITKATLTMSDGNTYDSKVGLGAAAGVLGTPLNPFPAAFSFTNVRIDKSNTRVGIPRETPVKLTVHVQNTLEYGIGLQLQCPNTYEWDLSNVLNVGLLAVGAGVVTYTGISKAM